MIKLIPNTKFDSAFRKARHVRRRQLGRKLDRKELETLEIAVIKQFGVMSIPEHNGILICQDQGKIDNLTVRIQMLERKMVEMMQVVGSLEEKLETERTLNSACTETQDSELKLESSNEFWKSYKDAKGLYDIKKTYMGEKKVYRNIDLPDHIVDTVSAIISPSPKEQDGARKPVYTMCCDLCLMRRKNYFKENCDEVLSILGSKRWMIRMNGWNVMVRDRKKKNSECFWQDDKT